MKTQKMAPNLHLGCKECDKLNEIDTSITEFHVDFSMHPMQHTTKIITLKGNPSKNKNKKLF